MEEQVGICKRCGENLLTDYGDLGSRYRNNVCSAGPLMSASVERAKQNIPNYCPRCIKKNRKDRIQKIIGFFKINLK